MRINKYVALATNLSRRGADSVINEGRVRIGDRTAVAGDTVTDEAVTLDGSLITPATKTTVMLHKPVGYVVSRDGQGSKTIFELLPTEYQNLQPVGRLDKDSSGLLLLTNDGNLANELTHPSKQKVKVYEVQLDKDLQPLHHQMINDFGVTLEDGVSKLQLERYTEGDNKSWIVRMSEGRNRQIRRTFAALGYEVKKLHRTHFGSYSLHNLAKGQTRSV